MARDFGCVINATPVDVSVGGQRTTARLTPPRAWRHINCRCFCQQAVRWELKGRRTGGRSVRGIGTKLSCRIGLAFNPAIVLGKHRLDSMAWRILQLPPSYTCPEPCWNTIRNSEPACRQTGQMRVLGRNMLGKHSQKVHRQEDLEIPLGLGYDPVSILVGKGAASLSLPYGRPARFRLP